VSLSKAQQQFTADIAELILYIYANGYSATFGDAYRAPLSHGKMGEFKAYGRARSAHKQRLAVDLNLFDRDGNYLTDTESHRMFGTYWKSLNQKNRWGGDFNEPDGNHYSREHWGIS
jgi:hypothetical protein